MMGFTNNFWNVSSSKASMTSMTSEHTDRLPFESSDDDLSCLSSDNDDDISVKDDEKAELVENQTNGNDNIKIRSRTNSFSHQEKKHENSTLSAYSLLYPNYRGHGSHSNLKILETSTISSTSKKVIQNAASLQSTFEKNTEIQTQETLEVNQISVNEEDQGYKVNQFKDTERQEEISINNNVVVTAKISSFDVIDSNKIDASDTTSDTNSTTSSDSSLSRNPIEIPARAKTTSKVNTPNGKKRMTTIICDTNKERAFEREQQRQQNDYRIENHKQLFDRIHVKNKRDKSPKKLPVLSKQIQNSESMLEILSSSPKQENRLQMPKMTSSTRSSTSLSSLSSSSSAPTQSSTKSTLSIKKTLPKFETAPTRDINSSMKYNNMNIDNPPISTPISLSNKRRIPRSFSAPSIEELMKRENIRKVNSDSKGLSIVWTDAQRKARSLNNIGTNHFRRGQYKAALRSYGEAIHIAKSEITSIPEGHPDDEKDEGDEHQNVVNNSKQNLNSSKDENHNQYYHHDLHLGSNTSIELVILLSQTLNAMGVVHWRMGEIEEADHALQDAYAIEMKSMKQVDSFNGSIMDQKKRNEEDYKTLVNVTLLTCKVTSLTNLGIVYKLKKEWNTALKYIADAVEMQLSLDNMIQSIQALRTAKNDSNWYDKIILNFINSKLSNSEKIVMLMGIMGTIFQAKNDFDNALKIQNHVLTVKRHHSRLKSNQPNLAIAIINVASLLLSANKNLDYAEKLFREALDIYVATLAPSNVDIGVLWHYLGRLHVLKKEFSLAHKCFHKANHVYDLAGLESQYMIKAALWRDMADLTTITWREDIQNVGVDRNKFVKNNKRLQKRNGLF